MRSGSPSFGGREYAQAIEDIAVLRKHWRADADEPKPYAARRTALLYNFDNRWDIDNHKQTARWNTAGHMIKHYKALKGLGAPVDVSYLADSVLLTRFFERKRRQAEARAEPDGP